MSVVSHNPLVLAASSLGPESQGVVRSALEAARRAQSRIHVLHALEPPPSVVAGGRIAFTLLEPGRTTEAKTALAAQLATVGARPEEVDGISVEPQHAAAAIVDLAERLDPWLIVTGAAAAPRPMHRLGATAAAVVREARQPILVVKGELELPAATVLAPVDLSLHSGDSLRSGLTVLGRLSADRPAAEVTALNVTPEAGDGGHSTGSSQLSTFLAEHAASHAGPLHHLVRQGDVVGEILAAAEQSGYELLLIGTHGRTGWRRLTLGSVAETLLRDAPCSLLVVPPAAARAQATATAADTTLAAR